jgi:hypothetical protein
MKRIITGRCLLIRNRPIYKGIRADVPLLKARFGYTPIEREQEVER